MSSNSNRSLTQVAARHYTPVIPIWMFLRHTLSPDHSYRNAVHRWNAWRTEHSPPKADSNTTAYCEAHQRLPEAVVAVESEGQV